MLRDRLVCGIENSHIQRRLLAEPNLTLDKAVEISLAMESADRNAKDLQKTPLPAVNTISPMVKPRAPPSVTPHTRAVECYRCGGPHFATECLHKDSECKNCKKKGHLARVCRSKKAKTNRPSQRHKKTQRTNPQQTNSVVATDTAETNDTNASAFTLFNLSSSPSKPYVVTVQVNGTELPMEVDTGASLTLSKTTFDKLWNAQEAPNLQPTTSKLRTYTGENIEVLGIANLNVSFQEQNQELQLLVVAGDGPSLLGRSLSKIRLNSG